MSIRLQAATDRHAAMTTELEKLPRSNLAGFTKNRIWVLIRAIRVQNSVLRLFVGQPTLRA